MFGQKQKKAGLLLLNPASSYNAEHRMEINITLHYL